MLFCFTIQAQKELQSFEYTQKEKETIIIKASAKSANNVTFYIHNQKGEPIVINDIKNEKDNEDNILKFTVSPFIETIFSSKLEEAIKTFKASNEYKENYKSFDNKKEDYRNIFQFFNALVITAFQYDTEPIAGTLKYGLDVTIYKEPNYREKYKKLIKPFSIRGFEFLKNQSFSDDELVNLKDYFIKEKNTIFKYGFEDKKFLFSHILSFFFLSNYELDNQKAIKKAYNDYEMDKFLQEHFSEYILNYYKIDSLNFEKKVLNNELNLNDIEEENLNSLKNNLKKIEEREKVLKEDIEKIEKTIKEYTDSYLKIVSNNIYELNIDKRNLNSLKNKLDPNLNEKEIQNIKRSINDLNEKIINKNKYIRELDSIYKNKINEEKNNKTLKDNELFDLYLKRIKQREEILNFNVKSINQIKINNNLEKLNNVILNVELSNDKIIKNILAENYLTYLWKFEIKDIQIDINDGFLEHISIIGRIKTPIFKNSSLIKSIDSYNSKLIRNEIVDSVKVLDIMKLNKIITNFFQEPEVRKSLQSFLDKDLKFENQFPIGFSSKSDFSDMYGYDLLHVERGEPIFKLPITEVLKVYNQKLQNDRLDFSPKNQVLSISRNNPHLNNEIELKKEQSSKILSARIYSDFLGFKESNPNGLIQAEIEKEIPLWTKRFPSPFFGPTANKGFFNYVKLNLTFSRIEDREQNLQVSYADEFVNNVYSPKKYVTYLDLVRRENTSVGLDANILSFDFTSPKLRLEINAGIHFARVRAIDSLKSETNTDLPKTNFFNKSVNTLRYYPDFILRVRPEERFGGFIRFRPFRILTPREEEFFSVSSRNAFLENREIKEAWLHRIEMSLFYKPNPKGDNKFFFRYRNTNVSTWETNGFGEFQVGYHAYLKF